MEQNKKKVLKYIWSIIPYIMIGLVTVFIVFLGVFISQKKDNLAEAKKAAMATEIPPVSVITLSLHPAPLADKIRLPAEVAPFEDLWIKAEVSGQAREIIAKEGQDVSEGDLLVKLDSRDYVSRLDQINANYKKAKLEYDRMKALVQKEIAAQTKYDEAEALLKDLSARRAEAELALERTRITAPINGRINEIKTKKGDLLKVGDPVAQILQYDRVKVTVGVPESDVAAVFDLNEAEIFIEALNNLKVTGKKIFLARKPRSLARLYDLELAVPNPDGRILPGMFASVELVKKVYPHALTIPLYAVISEGETNHVFIEVDGQAVKQPVELGIFSGWQVQVTSGLKENDRVIVVGHRFLEDGQTVNVIKNVTDPTEISAL